MRLVAASQCSDTIDALLRLYRARRYAVKLKYRAFVVQVWVYP